MARKRIRISPQQLKLWPPPAAGEAVPAPFSDSARGKRVHLIGIGGIGMSGIARLLSRMGAVVSGCDSAASDITESLAQRGIAIAIGHSPAHLDGPADLVIISAAVRDTNPELVEARRREIRVLKYAQALGWLMRGRDGIAVAGSHGKTTTTSMIAYALSYAGRNPAMVVGGIVPQLGGNSCLGRGGPFVVEACEYDRSFLSLVPRAAVITNIDRDHLDYYAGGLEELIGAFGDFAGRVAPDGILVVNGDDPSAMRAVAAAKARLDTYGEGVNCVWRVTEWSRVDGRTRFRATCNGKSLGAFHLLVPGFYNVRNALACIAICSYFGVNRQDVREALAEFRGARRRFDLLGEAGGVMVLDDYGHHPTEVKVTLDAARQEFPQKRLWCVFQPHQFSRTRMLLDDFAHSFGSADRVIVPDIYAARDSEADCRSVSSQDLVNRLRTNGVEAEYGSQFPQTIERLVSQVRKGDLVMTMGAGPVDTVGRLLLDELKRRESDRDGVV